MFVIAIATLFAFVQKKQKTDDRFISYIVDSQKQDLKLYWKNDQQETFKNTGQLKNWLEKKHKTLVFATNGGMMALCHAPIYPNKIGYKLMAILALSLA